MFKVLHHFGKHCICHLQGECLWVIKMPLYRSDSWQWVGVEVMIEWMNRGAGCCPIRSDCLVEEKWWWRPVKCQSASTRLFGSTSPKTVIFFHGLSVILINSFLSPPQKFRPRYCNRRGRAVRPKNVVVQRMLPLLPKAPNGHAMVTLKVIPQTSQLSGEFMPIEATVTTAPQQSHTHPAPLRPRPIKNHHILPAVSNKSNTGCLLVPSSNTSGLPDLGQGM
jgi:hypothetical protein